MKKLTVLLFFLVLIMTGLVTYVESMSVSPWAGYANLDMRELNRHIETEATLHGSTEITTNESGYVGGLDAGMFRFGYLYAAPAGYSAEILGIETNRQFESFLSMALIGVRMPHPARSIINIGIYGGYARASINMIETQKIGSTEVKNTVSYVGSNIISEAVLGVRLGIFEVDASFRYAIIKEVKVERDVDFDGNEPPKYVKGTTLKDENGDSVVFDYSGVMISIGLRFGPGPEAIVEDIIQGSLR